MRSTTQIRDSIKTITANSAKLRDKYHAVLCEVAGHTFEQGDPRMFDAILDGASGMNKKVMLKWIKANGFTCFNTEGKAVLNKSARKSADFADGDAVVEYLMGQTPWYEAEDSTAKAAKDLDVHALLAAALKRMDAMDAKEDGAKLTNSNPAATAELFNLLAERAQRLAA